MGQHIILKAAGADGSDIMKPYTPVTDDDTLGYVDFVIKVSRGPEPAHTRACFQYRCIASWIACLAGHS